MILASGVQNGLLLRSMFPGVGDKPWERQRSLKWRTAIPSAADLQRLMGSLDRARVDYRQGKHALYVPPQRDLDAVLGAAVSLYPADAGFKILKDLNPPDRARYLVRGRTYAQTLLTGLLPQQFDAGCYLALKGLGPAVYDLAELRSLDDRSMSAFVVQHVSSESPSAEESAGFVRRLEECVRMGEIAFVRPQWRELGDFRPPSAARNMLKSSASGSVFYIDYQEFVVFRERVVKRLVGPSGWADGRRTRTIPPRSKAILELLERGGGSLGGTLVLGIGGNTADTARLALPEGALWTLGWEDARRAEQTRLLLLALGFTRFTVLDRPWSAERSLDQDVPDRLRPYLKDSVICYRHAGRALEVSSALRDMPWRWLFLESPRGHPGGEHEAQVDAVRQVAKARVVGVREFEDVHSRPQTLTLVVREN